MSDEDSSSVGPILVVTLFICVLMIFPMLFVGAYIVGGLLNMTGKMGSVVAVIVGFLVVEVPIILVLYYCTKSHSIGKQHKKWESEKK